MIRAVFIHRTGISYAWYQQIPNFTYRSGVSQIAGRVLFNSSTRASFRDHTSRGTRLRGLTLFFNGCGKLSKEISLRGFRRA
jgi:hypothetical protein